MVQKTATLNLNNGTAPIELPVLSGTMGPIYPPPVTIPQLPSLMVKKGFCCIAVIPLNNWPCIVILSMFAIY